MVIGHFALTDLANFYLLDLTAALKKRSHFLDQLSTPSDNQDSVKALITLFLRMPEAYVMSSLRSSTILLMWAAWTTMQDF